MYINFLWFVSGVFYKCKFHVRINLYITWRYHICMLNMSSFLNSPTLCFLFSLLSLYYKFWLIQLYNEAWFTMNKTLIFSSQWKTVSWARFQNFLLRASRRGYLNVLMFQELMVTRRPAASPLWSARWLPGGGHEAKWWFLWTRSRATPVSNTAVCVCVGVTNPILTLVPWLSISSKLMLHCKNPT